MTKAAGEMYKSALNKSAGGILIINDQLQIEFINHWLSQALAIPSSAKDLPLLVSIPQAENPRFLEAVETALKRGVATRLSATFHQNLLNLKDPLSGETLAHSTNISALHQAGEIYCLVNIIDETRPLKREAMLADYIQKLKEAERQLQHSRDLAINASQDKSDFIARFSHQLRTPLNVILGFSELLANGALGELDQEQQDSAQQIFIAGSHLSDVVTQILFLSDAANFKNVEPEPISLPLEMNNLVAGTTGTGIENSIAIELELNNAKMQPVPGNRRLVKALLKNLLQVAITCQRQKLRVIISDDTAQKNVQSICFAGDYDAVKLTTNERNDRVMQSDAINLNTELDVDFLLELAQQLARQVDIRIAYSKAHGLRIELPVTQLE